MRTPVVRASAASRPHRPRATAPVPAVPAQEGADEGPALCRVLPAFPFADADATARAHPRPRRLSPPRGAARSTPDRAEAGTRERGAGPRDLVPAHQRDRPGRLRVLRA